MIKSPASVSFLSAVVRYKWLLLAPLGLLILPFLPGFIILYVFGINPFDPAWPYLTTNFLWGSYESDRWLIFLPLAGGIFLAALGYAGSKLKTANNRDSGWRTIFSISGGILLFVSMGCYLTILLFLLFFAIYPGQ